MGTDRWFLPILAFLSVLGVAYLIELVQRRESLRRELQRLPFLLPFVLGLAGVVWITSYVLRNRLSPDPLVIITLIILAALGPILWRQGQAIMDRIEQIGPLRLRTVETELASLTSLLRLTRMPTFNIIVGRGWQARPLSESEKRDLENFFSFAARIIDAIRATTDPQRLPFYVQKTLYEVMDRLADAAVALGHEPDALSYSEELFFVPANVISRLEIDLAVMRHRYALALSSVGDSLQAQSKTAEAKVYYRKATRLLEDLAKEFPIIREVHHNLGWHYDELGALTDAIRVYGRALEISPGWPIELYNRACAYSKRNFPGDLQLALNDLAGIPAGDLLWIEARGDPDLENIRTDQNLGPSYALLIDEKTQQ